MYRFLGYFQPQTGKPELWELDSDQHYNAGRRSPNFADENIRYKFLFFHLSVILFDETFVRDFILLINNNIKIILIKKGENVYVQYSFKSEISFDVGFPPCFLNWYL